MFFFFEKVNWKKCIDNRWNDIIFLMLVVLFFINMDLDMKGVWIVENKKYIYLNFYEFLINNFFDNVIWKLKSNFFFGN